jgi:hypothetical protein
MKILIEDICRKTPYTGSGQTKIFHEGIAGFICAIKKETKYRSAHEMTQSLPMSVDPISQLTSQRSQVCEFQRKKTTTTMRNNLMSMKNILFAAVTVFTFSQCTEEEIVPQQTETPAVEAVEVAPEATGSMTISGIFTSYEEIADCKTCTYVVPADVAIVDGKELDLKPGSVICLDKAKQYGDIDFVNLEGSEESPIRIGTTTFK